MGVVLVGNFFKELRKTFTFVYIIKNLKVVFNISAGILFFIVIEIIYLKLGDQNLIVSETFRFYAFLIYLIIQIFLAVYVIWNASKLFYGGIENRAQEIEEKIEHMPSKFSDLLDVKKTPKL